MAIGPCSVTLKHMALATWRCPMSGIITEQLVISKCRGKFQRNTFSNTNTFSTLTHTHIPHGHWTYQTCFIYRYNNDSLDTLCWPRSDIESLQFQMTFDIPRIQVKAQYRSSGVLILVQASGAGEYWGEYRKCAIYVKHLLSLLPLTWTYPSHIFYHNRGRSC